MRDVLKDLFSRSVAVTDTRDSMIDSSFLSLDERTYLENVSQNRKNEYIAGRFCAHQSMALANIPPVHIPIGNKGEPIWPSGVWDPSRIRVAMLLQQSLNNQMFTL